MKIDLDDNIICLFFHKPYDFYREKVSEKEIEDSFNKIEDELQIRFKKIIRPYQIHSNIVKIVTEENVNDNFFDVDGLITSMKGVALCTTVADCQGIAFYDTKNNVIGNIHSGWKGTLSRICSNAIDLMVKNYKTDPKDVKVYISPSIHKCHFEVSEDLKEKFEDEFSDIKLDDLITKGEIKEGIQRYYIDTVEINKRVLINLGVKKDNIICSDKCSLCNSDFIHSYRKDKDKSGRNLLLISMKTTK